MTFSKVSNRHWINHSLTNNSLGLALANDDQWYLTSLRAQMSPVEDRLSLADICALWEAYKNQDTSVEVEL